MKMDGSSEFTPTNPQFRSEKSKPKVVSIGEIKERVKSPALLPYVDTVIESGDISNFNFIDYVNSFHPQLKEYSAEQWEEFHVRFANERIDQTNIFIAGGEFDNLGAGDIYQFIKKINTGRTPLEYLLLTYDYSPGEPAVTTEALIQQKQISSKPNSFEAGSLGPLLFGGFRQTEYYPANKLKPRFSREGSMLGIPVESVPLVIADIFNSIDQVSKQEKPSDPTKLALYKNMSTLLTILTHPSIDANSRIANLFGVAVAHKLDKEADFSHTIQLLKDHEGIDSSPEKKADPTLELSEANMKFRYQMSQLFIDNLKVNESDPKKLDKLDELKSKIDTCSAYSKKPSIDQEETDFLLSVDTELAEYVSANQSVLQKAIKQVIDATEQIYNSEDELLYLPDFDSPSLSNAMQRLVEYTHIEMKAKDDVSLQTNDNSPVQTESFQSTIDSWTRQARSANTQHWWHHIQ